VQKIVTRCPSGSDVGVGVGRRVIKNLDQSWPRPWPEKRRTAGLRLRPSQRGWSRDLLTGCPGKETNPESIDRTPP
jgi:hypothetical protein